MADIKPPLPQVPASVTDPGQRDWMTRVGNFLAMLSGYQGSENQAVFFREAVNAGLLSTASVASEDEYDPMLDETVPDAPVLSGAGGFSYIILRVDNHDNLRNISYAEIWVSETNNRETAVLAGVTSGGVYSHNTGNNYTGFFWARFYTYSSVYSEWSSGITEGLELSTADDPQALLAVLEGKILESQLHQDLNTRIDLVDAPGTGLVSQVSQIASETDGLTTSLQETSQVIGGLSAQYSVKIDNNGAMAGFGLSSTTNTYDDTTHSKFIVNVDTFAITHPGSDSLFFAVDSGKVVMDAAYIVNLVVNDAQIESLAADKLFAAQGTIADLIVGEGDIDNAKIGDIIQSDNFESGSSGWRIHKSGIAEFRNIIARGNIEADRIKANAVDIVDTLNIKGRAVTIAGYAKSPTFTIRPGEVRSTNSLTFDPEGGGYILTAVAWGYGYDNDARCVVELQLKSGNSWVTKQTYYFGVRADSGVESTWELPMVMTIGAASSTGPVVARIRFSEMSQSAHNAGLVVKTPILSAMGGKR